MKKKAKKIKVRKHLPSHLTCERVEPQKKGKGSYDRKSVDNALDKQDECE